MKAMYGFKDGSGEWFLIIDTDKCDGCGKCVDACPAKAIEVGPDEADPFRDEPVARVTDMERKKLRYTCAPCRPMYRDSLPRCIAACKPGALSHTEAWKELYGNR